MVQTGVPFGNVGHARQIVTLRSILREEAPLDHLVSAPPRALASRPVLGYRCVRDEVSGRRLWEGLTPLWAPLEEEAALLDLIPGYNRRRDLLRRMLADCFVVNLCPLAFFEDGPRAANITPDKLPAEWRDRFVGDASPCRSYFDFIIDNLRPEVVIVMGDWVERTVRRWRPEKCAVRLPHPSPANPVANRGWAAEAQRILREAGLPWRSRLLVVCLELGVWLAEGEGDPPRTTLLSAAARFATREAAELAIAAARSFRPFPEARTMPARRAVIRFNSGNGLICCSGCRAGLTTFFALSTDERAAIRRGDGLPPWWCAACVARSGAAVVPRPVSWGPGGGVCYSESLGGVS